MPTYREALKINERYALDNKKEPSAIKLLMLFHTNKSSANLIQTLDDPMDESVYKAFRKSVDDYIIRHKPVQYITEKEYFYGHDFIVSDKVLIPRFETEELVGHVLDLKQDYFNDESVKLLDVGTGSGCLAITLSLEDDNINAYGTDISKEAIDVAKQNNKNLDSNVTFYEGSILEPVKGKKFDILVSNPPYIPSEEYVEPLVKEHEPHLALFGGLDGLDFYRILLKDAESILNDRYIIALEHAYDKTKALHKLIKKYLKHVRIIHKKDMQGKDRMTFILKKA